MHNRSKTADVQDQIVKPLPFRPITTAMLAGLALCSFLKFDVAVAQTAAPTAPPAPSSSSTAQPTNSSQTSAASTSSTTTRVVPPPPSTAVSNPPATTAPSAAPAQPAASQSTATPPSPAPNSSASTVTPASVPAQPVAPQPATATQPATVSSSATPVPAAPTTSTPTPVIAPTQPAVPTVSSTALALSTPAAAAPKVPVAVIAPSVVVSVPKLPTTSATSVATTQTAAVITPAVLTAPAGPILLIYRASSAPFGERDTVSALVYGDHSGATVHLRLIASGGRAAVATAVRGSDGDTEPLWAQWISPAITLDYRGWRKIDFPTSSFAYRPPVGEKAADAPKLATADAFGIDFDDRGETTMVDNLTWLSSSGTIAPVVVDDFETGDYASWQEHGTLETTQDAQIALVTDLTKVRAGRVAFSVSFAAAKQVRMQALALVKSTLALSGQKYLTYVPVSPFHRILPTSVPGVGETSQSIQLSASPDQSESGSFCIYSDTGMQNVTVVPTTSLQQIGTVIPKSNIDIRVVKVWNRAGIGKYIDPDATGPNPELLMKDDRQPLSFDNGAPPDIRLTGDPLTSIPAHTTKQFWVTVHVPKDAKPGTYNTQLAIRGPGIQPGSVSLAVDVLPLHLYSPSKQYIMALNCQVVADSPSGLQTASLCEDKDTFAAQLQDIHDHGFLFATLMDAPTTLWNSYSEYKLAALGTPLMYSGLTGSESADMQAAQDIDDQRRAQGVDSVAFIAPESVKPDELAALHKARMTTAAFVRTSDEFDADKDALDMPIYTVDEPYVQTLLRTGGLRVSDKFDYWVWPAYEDDPQANRLYAGYLLYRANLYGAFVQNYQPSEVGDPFSDSPDSKSIGDAAKLRPGMLTYPVQGGVLDTVQWEAVQAGVNDIRYLTTYYAALRECKDNHVDAALVRTTEPMVKGMMGKAFWVMDDTQYQKARYLVARYSVNLRKQLDAFYKHGGGDPSRANISADAKPPKPKPQPAAAAG